MNSNVVKIDKKIKQRLCDLANSSYPCECCAALFTKTDGSIDECCELTNTSSSNNRYSIDPVELYECESSYRKKGYEITGFFHSHPDAPAVMSEEDEKNVIPAMLYLLAPVTKEGCGRMRLWIMDSRKEA